MSNFTLLIICTVVYLAICCGIGIYTSRVEVKKASDFFLAGHSLGPIVLSLAMMATVFSAWFILGHQGLTWQEGFPYIAHYAHIPMMAMLGLMMFPRLWAIAKKNGFVTPAEMYGTYFNSEAIRILVLIIACLYAIPYVALQLRGAGYTFNILSGGRIDPTLGAVVLGIAVVFYVFLGGLRAAALTDTLQGCLLYVAAVFLGFTVVTVVLKAGGGQGGFFEIVKNAVATQGDGYITMPKLGAMWSWPYVLTIAMATAGIYFSPSYTMLTMAAQSNKLFKFQAFFIMALAMGLMYFFFSPLIGVGGRAIFTELPNADYLSLSLIFEHMGPVMFTVTSLGILAAMNSTAAGYLANTSSMMARDLYVRYMNPNASAGRQVVMGRLAIIVIVGLAVVFSVFVLDYLTLLGTLATAFGLLMAPAIFALCYCPSVTKDGVLWGLIAGIIAIILTYFVWRHPLGIHTGGWGFIANCIVCAIVSSFTEKPSMEMIHKFHGIWDMDAVKEIAAKRGETL
jgi:SSS family solute:Na+ symporter